MLLSDKTLTGMKSLFSNNNSAQREKKEKDTRENDHKVSHAHLPVFKLHVSLIFLFCFICIFSILFNVHKVNEEKEL